MTPPSPDTEQHATVTELSEFKIAVERRFGRVEKALWLLGLAVASPKLGGPDLSHAAAQAVSSFFT